MASTQNQDLTEEQLLEIARCAAVACMKRVVGLLPQITFDDLWGEAALRVVQALPRTEGYNAAQTFTYLRVAANRATTDYIRRETRCGSKWRGYRPTQVEFLEGMGGVIQPTAYSLVRLREVFTCKLSPQETRVVKNAAMGIHGGKSDATALYHARAKLRYEGV